MIHKLAIIGVGLIGSSLSLALRQSGVVEQVVGFGRNRDNLEKGVEIGVLDSYADSISATVKDADIVIVAVPLGAMTQVFAELRDSVSDSCVITDVGSTKGSVVMAAKQQLGKRIHQFVPGHPIAGTEKTGVEAGFATLFLNRRIILTPTSDTHQAAIDKIAWMWKQCGAEVEYTDTKHHDKVLGATSHLPHMLAFALVHHLSHLNEHEEIFRYAAGGFRDFTRIASSDPVMWRDVCIANGDELVSLIDQYQLELEKITRAIKNNDEEELLRLFGRAKSERDSLIGNC